MPLVGDKKIEVTDIKYFDVIYITFTNIGSRDLTWQKLTPSKINISKEVVCW